MNPGRGEPKVPPIHRRSTVLAIVTHWRCEPWLARCLESLVRQTRPPEGIVVFDDASPEPPTKIVRAFPQVTLLTSPVNVGINRLLQSLFDRMDYDAFLMQDADDWSSPDRLELLLAAAEASGAEMVGCQMDSHTDGVTTPPRYLHPADALGALKSNPRLMPAILATSLLGRDLVQRLGGLASGLRFGGDSEFSRRATLAAHTTNIPEILYHRLRRPDSLTTSPETGMHTAARKAVQALAWDRSGQNVSAVLAGRLPDLAPLAVAPSVDWRHLAGPELREQHRPARLSVPSRKVPVLVTGMFHSGTTTVAGLLRRGGMALPHGHPAHGPEPHAETARPETSPLTRLNDQCLEALGGAWDDPPEKPVVSLPPTAVDQAIATSDAQAHATPWGWDDPRTTLLLPFWHRVDASALVVHCVRHPLEVACSLQQQCGMSLRRALGLWRRYNECFLSTAPAARRQVVHHDQLVDAPIRTLERLAPFCGLTEPTAGWAAVVGDLDPGRFQHRLTTAERAEVSMDPEILRLYATLCREAGLEDMPAPPPSSAPSSAASSGLVDLAAMARLQSRRRWSEQVTRATRAGARVAVVSKGDDRVLDLPGRTALHFPSDPAGQYLGYHPADCEEAVDRFQRLLVTGVDYLAFPVAQAWWLDFYPGLHRQLSQRHTRVDLDPEVGVLYRLERGS